jgi:iron complex transport system substrate-binding protein
VDRKNSRGRVRRFISLVFAEFFFGHLGEKMKKGLNPFKKSVAVAISVLTLAACGSTTTQDAKLAPTGSASFPVTISNNGNDVTITAKPVAIVSLSPTATEMLFAIGAGDQVIAVDDQSTFPAEAPITDLSGFTPNIEAIVAKQPDLVIVSNDIDNVIAALQSANIPVLLEGAATNLDDTYAQITELGLATGQEQGAAELVASMKAEIGTAVASLKKPIEPITYYHELDPTFYTVTSFTFIGQLYALAGLENIADAAPDAETGYPQLSAEYIVKSNPQLIFLADTKCCSVTAAQLLNRPGFSSLDAVKNGLVIELDDDVASRWGPRTTELFAAIIEAINKVTTS